MTNRLFEQALGIRSPWHVNGVEFSAEEKRLTIHVDFEAGARFAVEGREGVLLKGRPAPISRSAWGQLLHLLGSIGSPKQAVRSV